MGGESGTVEAKVARMACQSYGVVTRAELGAAGISSREIDRRLKRGDLIRVHRGVFRVGHAAPSLESHYLAAVKACGAGSLLAGTAARHLYGLFRGHPSLPEVLTRGQRRPHGVVTHRARRTDVADAAEWRGVPVTTVSRTIVDLAGVLNEEQLARAFHEAVVKHRATPHEVEQVLSRRHNWPGARKLRRVIRGEAPLTLSRLEREFLARLGTAGLPQPETNQRIGNRYVDCRWPHYRLTVELDSYRYHGTRHAWEEDHERERKARARGDEFRRYTWRDVVEDPEPMLADLRLLLPHPPP